MRKQKAGDRIQKTGVRRQESEVRRQNSHISDFGLRNLELKNRSQETGDRR
jgi:hypothetical protein